MQNPKRVAKSLKRKKKKGKGNVTKLSDFDHAIIGFKLGGLDQLLFKSIARCECKSKGANLPSCIISSLQTSNPWHQLHAFVHICFHCALSFYTLASVFSLLLQHVHFAFDLHCTVHFVLYTLIVIISLGWVGSKWSSFVHMDCKLLKIWEDWWFYVQCLLKVLEFIFLSTSKIQNYTMLIV